MKIHIDILTLEPGKHFARKTIDRRRVAEIEIPDAECQEIRPDWGVYHPTTTFPAIERALKKRGCFSYLPENEQYSFGISK